MSARARSRIHTNVHARARTHTHERAHAHARARPLACARRFRTLLVKTLGIAFSVSGGLLVGKEGPLVHSGCIVAAGISQGPPRGMPRLYRILRRFRNDKDKRDFISMGAAAGVAAAFGAPLGGVLFSFEEASTHWSMVHTLRTFACAVCTTTTMNFLLQFVYARAHPPTHPRASARMQARARVRVRVFPLEGTTGCGLHCAAADTKGSAAWRGRPFFVRSR
jgi:hypothetical protein